jgi:hypothetical protein
MHIVQSPERTLHIYTRVSTQAQADQGMSQLKPTGIHETRGDSVLSKDIMSVQLWDAHSLDHSNGHLANLAFTESAACSICASSDPSSTASCNFDSTAISSSPLETSTAFLPFARSMTLLP